MTENDQAQQIVRTIVELARVLGMDVVAEGIESGNFDDLARERKPLNRASPISQSFQGRTGEQPPPHAALGERAASGERKTHIFEEALWP